MRSPVAQRASLNLKLLALLPPLLPPLLPQHDLRPRRRPSHLLHVRRVGTVSFRSGCGCLPWLLDRRRRRDDAPPGQGTTVSVRPCTAPAPVTTALCAGGNLNGSGPAVLHPRVSCSEAAKASLLSVKLTSAGAALAWCLD